MGISSSTKIIVGHYYDDLVDLLGEDELNELIDDCELETGSIYYDSSREQNVIGYAIISDSIIELDSLIMQEIEEAKSLFEKTYMKPKVFVTLDIT